MIFILVAVILSVQIKNLMLLPNKTKTTKT